MKVGVRIDGLMILIAVALAVLWYLSRVAQQQWEKHKDKINPYSDQNLIYQGAATVADITGVPQTDSRGVAIDDYIFAVIDKINPFNESDFYAEYVLSGRKEI